MEIVLAIAVLGFATLMFWVARRFPNPSKRYPGALRMPRFVQIFGWLILLAGVMMGLVAFSSLTSQGAEDVFAMRIASVCTAILGALLLMLYRNFWVVLTPREIHYRSAFTRQQKHIPVEMITRVDAVRQNGAVMATFVSTEKKFTLNIAAYDASPVIDELIRRDVPMSSIIRTG